MNWDRAQPGGRSRRGGVVSAAHCAEWFDAAGQDLRDGVAIFKDEGATAGYESASSDDATPGRS